MRSPRHRFTVVAPALLGLAALVLPGTAPRAPAPGTVVELTASGDFSSSTAAAAVLDDVKRLDPDLHVALGDLSYGATGAEDAWCAFVTSRVGAGFPFQLVAGNHESNGQNGNINDFSACLPNQLPGLVGTYGRQWFADVPASSPLVRVVGISPGLSYPSGDWSYAAGSTRYAWTADAVDGARAAGIPWVVVAMHKPCLSVGLYGCEVGADIMNLLVAKDVDLVLHGHEHSYMRTHQLAHGPGCTSLVPGAFTAACVADADSAFGRGGGTVFATVGTGGTALREINAADPEAGYFAASSGLNADPTWGSLHVRATTDTLEAGFRRAHGGTFTDTFTVGPELAPPPQDPPPPDPGPDPDPVPDPEPAPPAALARDAFERTASAGWGAADAGGAWSTGSGTSYSVSGGAGRIVMTAPAAGRWAFLDGVTARDVDAQVSAALDKPATGGGTDLTLAGRRTASGNEYRTQVKVLATGGVRVALRRFVAGSGTTLAQVNVPGLSYSPGQQLRVRLQVSGTSPTTLRTRVWTVGSPEPATWLLETTDSTAALQSPGSVGVVTYVSSSATNTPVEARFDDLLVNAP